MNGQKNSEITKMNKKHQKIEETQILPDEENMEWIHQEICNLEGEMKERKPSLKFEELKITEFSIDFSKPFDKFIDPLTGVIKKIIPVNHNGEEKNLWLNVKNPLYCQILKKYVLTEDNNFKVIQIGNQNNTKYELVE